MSVTKRRPARRRRGAYPGRVALSEAVESGAAQDSAGDVASLTETELVARYDRVLVSIVQGVSAQFRVPHDLRDDMFSDARLGLLAARERFDATLGVAFSTFAYYRIKGAVVDGLRRAGVMARQERVDYALDRAASALGEGRCVEEADKRYEHVLARVDSTIRSMGSAHLVIHDAIDREQERAGRNPAAVLDQAQHRTLVRAALDELTELEREVIVGIYYQGLSLREVGDSLGYSRSWTSRIHGRALERMADHLCERAPNDFEPP